MATASSQQRETDNTHYIQRFSMELARVNATRMLAFSIAFVVFQAATLIVNVYFVISGFNIVQLLLFAGEPLWVACKVVAIVLGILCIALFGMNIRGAFKRPQTQDYLFHICLSLLLVMQAVLCFFEYANAYFVWHFLIFILLLGALPVLPRVASAVYALVFTLLCWLPYFIIDPFAEVFTSSASLDAFRIGEVSVAVFALIASVGASWFTYGVIKKSILEKIKMEEQVEALEAVAEERALEYKEKARKAEAANIAKTRFLTRVSHSMRTSMTTISGMAFLAKESEDPGQIKESLDAIEEASNQLRNIVDTIIDTAKIETEFAGDDYNQDHVLPGFGVTVVQKPVEQVAPPDLSGHNILIVEDLEINRLVLTEFLKDTKATIEEAANGKIALEMFSSSPEKYYSFVFMDLLMPEMDGYDATRAIRKLNRADASAVPIVAISANAYKEDIEASLAAGMDAHLSKPVDQAVLFRTLIERLK